MKKNWIKDAINPKRKGALHRALGVKMGTKIRESLLRRAAKKKGKLGARARLALTLRTFHR